MVAQAAVKRDGKLFLRNCNELHKGRTPFAPVNVAALAIQLLIESKDDDIRYLIHGRESGADSLHSCWTTGYSMLGEEMHYLESSRSQMYGRHVWNESLVFGQTSQFCKKSDPFTGILSRNE
jgi:hypothetical protein